MEQKEKKQKSQAAENQVSCPPQQPASPHPFISVIPLAVLIALIVLVVKLFPDDALAGASQVAIMIATAVCVALSMGIYRMKWNIFEEMIKKTVGDAGNLMDHHCHHWHCPDGNRRCPGNTICSTPPYQASCFHWYSILSSVSAMIPSQWISASILPV